MRSLFEDEERTMEEQERMKAQRRALIAAALLERMAPRPEGTGRGDRRGCPADTNLLK